MRTSVSVCCVTALALALSACDGDVPASAAVTTAPSTAPVVVASISPATVLLAPGLSTTGCIAYPPVAAAFNIVIVAWTPMDLNLVTMHLIDGSNVGGPMVTFPRPELTRQFGTTVVHTGIARTFTFRPQFPCGSVGADHVAAQLTLVDAKGAARSVTVAGPLL